MSSETVETATGYENRRSTSADSSGSQDPSPSEGMASVTPQSSSTTSGDKDGDSPIFVDDPFDNEKRQILFDAIDRLQARGSHADLEIPQVFLHSHATLANSKLRIPSSSS
jgi:hypothetical protein